jgi:rsbT co-antagonist protein RsbR
VRRAAAEAGAESDEYVSISAARIERLITVIAMASTVSVERAIEMLDAPVQDSFGVVEEGFGVFLAELRDAKIETAEAVEQLTRSKEDVEQKLLTIEQQRGEIEELSAPIIDLWDGILALPLIGRIDADRTARITEALLHRVVASRTRWVIIDLTGVGEVDATTASSLIGLTTAAELIGSQCILTGIRPTIVDALLASGDLTARLQPRRTLQEGLRHCLAALRARDARAPR